MEDFESGTALDAASTNYLFNGIRLGTRLMTAQHATTGGDWCETFVLSDHLVGLSIGDVCGHGAEASAAMVVVRQTVRDTARRGLDPAQALSEANRFVLGYDPQLFVTAIFALLDTRDGTLTFANAGHLPPLVVGPSGSYFLSFGVGDLPLGIDATLQPALRVLQMPARTLLVLYTDGVIEHERQPVLGERQLRNAAVGAYVAPAAPTAAAIERLMHLSAPGLDDASILTAWAPRASLRRNAGATSRLRHRRLRAFMADARRPEKIAARAEIGQLT